MDLTAVDTGDKVWQNGSRMPTGIMGETEKLKGVLNEYLNLKKFASFRSGTK
jgi:hypothetical protein